MTVVMVLKRLLTNIKPEEEEAWARMDRRI